MPIAFFNDAAQDITTLELSASEAVSEVVLRSGKYFECDKEFTDMNGVKFTVTEAEADAVLPLFTGADLNQEHGPSIFDGLLGRVNRLWRDGKDIRAEYAIPKLLHQHMNGRPIKVSSEWDMATKRPLGAALVLNPAVEDAVMMAAFSAGNPQAEVLLAEKLLFAMTRHNTPEGQMAMQDLHDTAARAGSVCDRQNVSMASQHEATAVQKIHDIAADHGANCKSGDKPAYYSQQRNPIMTAWEKIVAFCKGHGMNEADAAELLATPPAQFATPAGMTEAEKARFAALEADNARLKTLGVEKDAVQFADAEIAACRVYPTERASLITLFCQAAADDAASAATVSFSALEDGKLVEKTGGRLDALRAGILHRPPHGLTAEQLKTAAFSDGAVILG